MAKISELLEQSRASFDAALEMVRDTERELDNLRKLKVVMDEYIETTGSVPGNNEYWRNKFNEVMSGL